MDASSAQHRAHWGRRIVISVVAVVALVAVVASLGSGGTGTNTGSQPPAPTGVPALAPAASPTAEGSTVAPVVTAIPTAAAAPTPTAAPRGRHTVRYVVTVGAGNRSSISYANTTNGTDAVGGYVGDWDKVVSVGDRFTAYVMAVASPGTPTVTCAIELDGRPWKTSTSSGDYATATCMGFVGLE